MRNKIKRSKHCKDSSCRRKEQVKPTGVITLMSESSCSTDELSPQRDSASLTAKGKYGSDALSAAGFSAENVQQQQQEEMRSCCVKDIKIAPIFLRTTKPCKSKRSHHGESCQPVEKQREVLSLHTEDLQRVKVQQLLSASTPVTEKDGCALSTWRGQLSTSALNICLKEIQTSNPTFPVQTVFSTLQKKASDRLQQLGSTG